MEAPAPWAPQAAALLLSRPRLCSDLALPRVGRTLGGGSPRCRLSGGPSRLTTQLHFQRLPWDVASGSGSWNAIFVSHPSPMTARGSEGPRSFLQGILRRSGLLGDSEEKTQTFWFGGGSTPNLWQGLSQPEALEGGRVCQGWWRPRSPQPGACLASKQKEVTFLASVFPSLETRRAPAQFSLDSFFFFFLVAPMAWGTHWASHQTRATAVT